MINFKIHLEGNKEDAKILDECMVDEGFESDDDPKTDVEFDEYYALDDIDTMVNLAISIASKLPECDFVLSGYIDTSELAGEYMDFIIEHKSGRLLLRNSSWYVRMDADDWGDDYEGFAEVYSEISKEQFEEFKKGEYYILDSGDGDFVKQVPLSYESEIDINRQSVCPICGEPLHDDGVPVFRTKEGTEYHIWCAEDAGIEGELV